MRKLLCLVLFLAIPLVSKGDEIDTIVKQAIAQAAPQNAKAMPRARIEESTTKGPCEVQGNKKCSPDCVCGPDCDCPNCQCKPGYKCDGNSCRRLTKSGSEAPVERCWVIVDDVKIFTVDNMTPTEAMSAIRAQGSKVVFIDRNNTVVDPPSWYSGKVALSHSMVQQRYTGGQVIETQPQYYQGGFQAGFGFSGPFGGNFQAGACVGGT